MQNVLHTSRRQLAQKKILGLFLLCIFICDGAGANLFSEFPQDTVNDVESIILFEGLENYSDGLC